MPICTIRTYQGKLVDFQHDEILLKLAKHLDNPNAHLDAKLNAPKIMNNATIELN